MLFVESFVEIVAPRKWLSSNYTRKPVRYSLLIGLRIIKPNWKEIFSVLRPTIRHVMKFEDSFSELEANLAASIVV